MPFTSYHQHVLIPVKQEWVSELGFSNGDQPLRRAEDSVFGQHEHHEHPGDEYRE